MRAGDSSVRCQLRMTPQARHFMSPSNRQARYGAQQNKRFRTFNLGSPFSVLVSPPGEGAERPTTGFGLCGTAETLITAIWKRIDLRDLTVVSNNAGTTDRGGLGEAK